VAKNKELPLLPSTVKEWKEKVTVEKNRADQIYGVCHRKFNSIILRADYLTVEQKEKLIEELMK
jgi:hypothetical protein